VNGQAISLKQGRRIMKLIDRRLDGILLLENNLFVDHRGDFRKFFGASFNDLDGGPKVIREIYVSVTNLGCLRGLHYQVAPFRQGKLLTVVKGRIFDVAVGIDPERQSYKQVHVFELSDNSNQSLYIPGHFAHGFLSLTNDSMTVNCLDEIYSPQHERGIRYDALTIPWPTMTPTLSEKDAHLPGF
jgi:dTDP-4-dehydrorhamnose 3,5-epimerase